MPDSPKTLDRMAAEFFELYQLIATVRSRQPAESDEPSEAEFLTLDVLAKEEPITIGEVQKRVGVLPAQMSRIIRALETGGGRGLVECKINAKDRRRIDVSLTEAGRAAHERYRTARLHSMHSILLILPREDREHTMRIVGLLKDGLKKHLDIHLE